MWFLLSDETSARQKKKLDQVADLVTNTLQTWLITKEQYDLREKEPSIL